MAKAKNWLISSIFVTISLVVANCLGCDNNDTTGVKGLFVFGDDVVDPGNNNRVLSFYMKANFLPYGIDFEDGPSGRFTNGKTIVDSMADELAIPYPTPYPYDSFQDIDKVENGVNFGSTGTGLFSTTGSHAITKIKHMWEQIFKFRFIVKPKLEEKVNCKGPRVFSKYLFVIASGNNDYSSWWILKQYIVVNPQYMASLMVDHMSNYLKALYASGARKFLLVGTYPIGCNPGIVREKSHCIDFLNNATAIYHEQLLVMIEHLQQMDMSDAQFSVFNANKVIRDIYDQKTNTGITKVDCPCCALNLGDICKKAGKTCLDREKYLYFDGYHLTQAANCFMAKLALSSDDESYITPKNVNKLKDTPINLRTNPPPLAPSPEYEP